MTGNAHPMRDRRARAPYLFGRGLEVCGAILAGVGLWLIGASPMVLGWAAAALGAGFFAFGRRQAHKAWEHLPAVRRGDPEPGWLTVLAGGISIATVALGAFLGASHGPLSAAIAVVLGGVGMYRGYRNLQADPGRAAVVVQAVLLVASVGVATAGVRHLLS